MAREQVQRKQKPLLPPQEEREKNVWALVLRAAVAGFNIASEWRSLLSCARAKSPWLCFLLAAGHRLDGGDLWRVRGPNVVSAFVAHHWPAFALAVPEYFG